MSIEEKFNEENNKLQQRILLEIERAEKGLNKRSIPQLQTILKELQGSIKTKNIVLSYPRIIVDSWDYADQLSIELIELAELYRKLQQSVPTPGTTSWSPPR